MAAEAPPPPRSQEERLAWVAMMRTRFSPVGMWRDAEGRGIDQDFFKPKHIIIRLTDEPKESWGDAQREALYQGLERFGVGKWREMIDHFPPLARYGDTDLRAHAARLLGTQSLARHVGWKGGRAAVEAERTKHLRIGRELGCIKNGVLVEDDAGSVAAYFEAHPVEDPSQQQQQQQQQRQRQQGAG